MRISLVQMASPSHEPVEERVDRLGEMVLGQARGADLVVLLELWSEGYFAFEDYPQRAESSVDGRTVAAGRSWARQPDSWVTLGRGLERSPDGLHNTAVVIDPTGEVVHRYRKIHVVGCGTREAAPVQSSGSVPARRHVQQPRGAADRSRTDRAERRRTRPRLTTTDHRPPPRPARPGARASRESDQRGDPE